jgi:UDP-glucose 4-epimerase
MTIMASKKLILVTGIGGYIGSITADLLLQKGYRIVGIDNFSRGYTAPLKLLKKKYGEKNIEWYNKDLTKDSLDIVFRDHKIHAVLHFAALANVGESWENPEKYFGNNITGVQRLAEIMIKTGIKNLVFSSTCAVYGNAQYSPMDENHPLDIPASPYGASKMICEEILSWYAKMGILNTIFLRYFNVTGASDNSDLGDSKRPSFHLIQNAVRGALEIDKFELNFAKVNTPDGSPIRDYINVVDLANAHIKALEYLLDGGESNIFNLGTGDGNSVLEIIDIVKKKTGKDFPIGESKNRRAGEADKMIADISKAKKVLKWEPTHTLDQSIESLVKWYGTHPNGWEK